MLRFDLANDLGLFLSTRDASSRGASLRFSFLFSRTRMSLVVAREVCESSNLSMGNIIG